MLHSSQDDGGIWSDHVIQGGLRTVTNLEPCRLPVNMQPIEIEALGEQVRPAGGVMSLPTGFPRCSRMRIAQVKKHSKTAEPGYFKARIITTSSAECMP